MITNTQKYYTAQHYSLVGLIAWFICGLFFCYELLLRTVVGTFQAPIMQDLHINPVAFSLLSTSAYMFIYALMQIPVGIIVDRYGLKRSITFATLLCAVSTLLLATTTNYKVALLCRMLMGLGSSFGFIGVLVAVYQWFPKELRGFYFGLSALVGTGGLMIAAGPIDSLAIQQNLSWRHILLGLGIIGLCISALSHFRVTSCPNRHQNFNSNVAPSEIKAYILNIISQKQAWSIAIYIALVCFTLEYLSENEFKHYMQLHGFEANFASYLITVGWMGYALGCPMLGFLSDIVKNKKVILVVASVVYLLATLVIFYLPISEAILVIAFFALGMATGTQSIGFSIILEYCKNQNAALGIGFQNMLTTLFLSINAPVLGSVIHQVNPINQPNIANYQSAFTLIICGALLSLMIALFTTQSCSRRARP